MSNAGASTFIQYLSLFGNNLHHVSVRLNFRVKVGFMEVSVCISIHWPFQGYGQNLLRARVRLKFKEFKVGIRFRVSARVEDRFGVS